MGARIFAGGVVAALLMLVMGTAAAQQELRFGFTAGFTGGPAAVYGAFARRAVEMAVDEINAKGGVDGKKLVPITVDDQANPTVSVNVVRRFIAVDKVPVIVGAHTNTSLATIPIADQAKIVFITGMSVHPQIAKMSPWSFRLATNFLKTARHETTWVHKQGGRKLALLIFNNESTRRLAELAKKTWQDLGGEVLAEEILPMGGDYRSTIDKVRAKSPDTLYISSFVSETAKVVKQMAERGWRPTWVTASVPEDPKFFDQVGDAAEGLVYASLAGDPKTWNDWAERYRKRYGEEPELFGAHYYDIVYVLADAIKRGGYTAEGIQKALLETKNFKGVTGTITFDADGDTDLAVGMKQVKGRKYVFLEGQ